MTDHETAGRAGSPLRPIELAPVEARVLGCLMEKQRTTPEQYPLTLNALVNACNQKSSRHPVMQLAMGEVGHTVNQLRDRGLIHASFAGRTERYDHKMVGTYHLSREEQAVLAVLMLRGPQTLGELRLNTARMAEFADLGAVGATLRSLMDRSPALVMELPRLPGRREERYAHLLCGEPPAEAIPVAAASATASPEGVGQGSRLAELEAEVASLRAELDRLWELTGLAGQRAP
ncbi:MAG: YceH family protein [Bdellovibrio bacteriovorus]